MERNSACGESVSRGKNATESCLSCGLRNDISSRLEITSDSMSNNSDYPAEYEDEEEENEFSEEELLAQMGYGKPYSSHGEITEEHQNLFSFEEEELSDEYMKKERLKHEPIMMTPSTIQNLVSAMKGSREKEGKPARECRVSWAPDLYDPPPPSDEHLDEPGTERRKNERKVKGRDWKNRQETGGEVKVGAESVGGAKQGSMGGGRKAGLKDKGKKQMKKKHGGSAAKFSFLDD